MNVGFSVRTFLVSCNSLEISTLSCIPKTSGDWDCGNSYDKLIVTTVI